MEQLKTKVKIDPNQTELTEEQNAALAQEAIAEVEADERGAEPDDQEPEPFDKPDEGEKKPGEGDAEPPAGDKPAGDQGEPAPKEGEQQAPADEKAEADLVREHALKHNITEEEAKVEIDDVKGILGKYKTPEEIARALRSTQSAYDKLKAAAPKPGEPEKAPAKPVMLDNEQAESGISEYVDKNREKLLEDYGKRYPAKSTQLSEEAILEEIADKMNERYQSWKRQEQGKMAETALTRREELLTGLSKEDAKFLPDIKAVLYRTSDAQVLREGFDLKDLVQWAKGAKYDADVKAAREEGIRIGKDDPKILGEIPRGGSGKTPPNKSSGATKVFKLSDRQKQRALEMYDHLAGTEDDKYKMFVETYEDELKANPTFVG